MRIALNVRPAFALIAQIALLAPLVVSGADPAAAPRTPPVTLRIYDAGEVPPRTRAAAQTLAADILRRAEVPVAWVACTLTSAGPAGPAPCGRPPEPRDLLVRLVRAPEADPSKSLGYSLIDVGQRRGWLATILVDRVDRLVETAATDRAVLLGRTIAHEVAHLLLGSTRHSARGLLRAKWTAADLARNRPWDWRFSDEDARLLRVAYAARIAQPGTPPARLAELLATPPGGVAPRPQ